MAITYIKYVFLVNIHSGRPYAGLWDFCVFLIYNVNSKLFANVSISVRAKHLYDVWIVWHFEDADKWARMNSIV